MRRLVQRRWLTVAGSRLMRSIDFLRYETGGTVGSLNWFAPALDFLGARGGLAARGRGFASKTASRAARPRAMAKTGAINCRYCAS